MTLEIPDHLAAKANRFPESSYGAVTVTVVLSDGTRISDVILSGATIVKVKDKLVSVPDDLNFRASDIVNVLPESRFPRLRLIAAVLVRALLRRK